MLGEVGEGMPYPQTVENRNNEILFRLKAVQLQPQLPLSPRLFS